MAETTISWTDYTFNPWIGCTEVSPGCDNCYARTLDRRWGHDSWGKGKLRRRTSEANWRKPLAWEKIAAAAGTTAHVFSGSMCDIMDDEAPAGARHDLWRLIDSTPHLVWQLLSKRPQRFERFLPAEGFRHGNVILMATVEKQEFYLPRIEALNRARLALDARTDLFGGNGGPAKTGISYEPALGPLSIAEYPGLRPHWVIFGGETGAHPRGMELTWAENIKRECEEFGVAFWMKQMSAQTPAKAAALIPVEMLVRQHPDLGFGVGGGA